MTDIDLPEPVLIETKSALEEWMRFCSGFDLVALDTEGDSFHHYQEQTCLLQMTAGSKDAIIDPLVFDDLEPMREVLEGKTPTVVLHDAIYDMVCLRRDFDMRLDGMFDTMLATRLLGKPSFGLAAVLNERFGITLDKKWQRSDWAARPLKPAQLVYAQLDTHFLPKLAPLLKKDLQAQGRWEWAQEEFDRLPSVSDRLNVRPPRPDPDGFWRIKGMGKLKPRALGNLKALYFMREEIAERLDRPPFKVLTDQALVSVALDGPQSLSDLVPRSGLRRGAIDRFGRQIVSAIKSAEPVHGKAPPGVRKKRRNGRFLDDKARERYEELRGLRKTQADAAGIDPEILLSNAFLDELAREPTEDLDRLVEHENLVGWRADLFGDALRQLLQRLQDH